MKAQHEKRESGLIITGGGETGGAAVSVEAVTPANLLGSRHDELQPGVRRRMRRTRREESGDVEGGQLTLH